MKQINRIKNTKQTFFKCSWSFIYFLERLRCLDSSPQQKFMVFNLHLCPSFPLLGVELTLPQPQTFMPNASLPTSPDAAPDCSSVFGCISSLPELEVHPGSSWDPGLRAAGCRTCSVNNSPPRHTHTQYRPPTHTHHHFLKTWYTFHSPSCWAWTKPFRARSSVFFFFYFSASQVAPTSSAFSC